MKSKQKYTQPSIEVVHLQLQSLLAGSPEPAAGGPSADYMSNPGFDEE